MNNMFALNTLMNGVQLNAALMYSIRAKYSKQIKMIADEVNCYRLTIRVVFVWCVKYMSPSLYRSTV